MDKKIKTIEVVAKDFYGENCLVDSSLTRSSQTRKPEGMVEVYDLKDDGSKKLIRKNNLVLYQGRETLAQMLVRTNTVDDGGIPPLVPVAGNGQMWLNWFGLGNGAAATECSPGSGDVFAPEAPTNMDTELACPIMINATDSSAADLHYEGDPGYPGGDCQGTGGLYPDYGFYKHPFDDITFEQDAMNDNKWLVIRVSIIIGVTDANGKTINEAGLYTSESNLGMHSGDFPLFARVTFPTLLKDSSRRLQFVWYLFV